MNLVSIIIPVYNAAKTLEKCVDSVLNQTYKNIQIILVNDGSTDRSLQMCYAYAEKDNRVTVINKQNGGVSSARNIGIVAATGAYVMFLDSDDWYETDIVERYVSYMIDSDIVIGQLSVFSESDNSSYVKKLPSIGKFGKELWNTICEKTEMFGYIGGKMFKNTILKKHNIRFNENMYAQEDLDFCLSYYGMINTFSLIDYAGYGYFYQEGKRNPPYIDFINNQLKLLSIAKSFCEISAAAKLKIQQKISGYIYMLFYDSHTKEQVFDVCNQLKEISMLEEYLLSCKLKGQKKYIVSWYLKGQYTLIYRYFKIRNFIKILLGRNK